MSTTDTKAAFEALPENGKLNLSKVPDGSEYISFCTQLAWRNYQAATEAAKATGTAGEPDAFMVVQGGDEPVSVHFQRINAKISANKFSASEIVPLYRAEAARQPAPVATSHAERSIRTWRERCSAYAIQHMTSEAREAIASEIADLRSALAATAAPVLSNISAGLSIPDAKDFDPVGLNPYVVQEADAIPKISLSDDQLDKIARSYFAEEWAQNHLKNAIHDAFITARSQP